LKSFVDARCGAILALTITCASAARADDPAGRWRFGDDDDGQAVTASVSATNKLNSGNGALSYSPVFTVVCRKDGEPRWSERLQLSEAVSATNSIAVSVTLDRQKRTSETWTVARRGRFLVREGADGVARLVPASQLRLSWRFGLITGRSEADFDLSGAGQAIGKIAEACGAELN
jgi:hypothetical protein